ncbi:MAG: membrane protein insertase YidC [Deltaproteobacteria bacterium]|nr:MAG: membrane protein insertase YidC [Deltaproteobacteria bacterium]
MERRLLLALALSVVVLMLYQDMLRRYRPAPRPPVVSRETPPPPPPPEPAPAGELGAPPSEAAPVVTVDTDVVQATISTLGARLLKLELKQYRRSVQPDSPALDLVQPGPVLPLTLQLGPGVSDAGLTFHVDGSALVLHGGERGAVTFVADTPGGRLEKRYVFSGDDYVLQLIATQTGAASQTIGVALTPLAADSAGGGRTPGRETAVALHENRLIEKSATDLARQAVTLADCSWAGFATQYFMSAAMPADARGQVVMTTAAEVPIVRIDVPVIDGRASAAVFVGPKDRAVLTRAGRDLDRALDFGWFWFIAIPLLRALHLLRAVTGNYGVAIIVLTVLVKLATTPLTQTTFRNMREMQKIQPQMAKLKERFKDDQMALQKEMMELYRRHRVNPLSGCLPMVLQLPIFVGLYNALSHAIELRHAPFALWINDLSAPDRLPIPGIPIDTPLIGAGVPVLTLVMGASMFVQQWLTPQQGDPAQQRMMMFMPILFTYMFMNFPAGLVLYWLVNNVLTIGQQYLSLRSAT